MSENEKQLFAKALREAMVEKRTTELEACTEDGSCTKAHLRKISNIIGANVTGDRIWIRPKYVLVAILISAALLLSGCSVYVMRHYSEIRDFFEEVFEKFARVTYDDNGELQENMGGISHIYELTYIPEEYKLIKSEMNSLYVHYTWQDNQENRITFEQRLFDGTNFSMDVEESEIFVVRQNDITIYSQASNTSYRYVWNNGKYAMSLISTMQLSEETLSKIIDGIVIKSA